MITALAPKHVVKALLFYFKLGLPNQPGFWYHVEGDMKWSQIEVPKRFKNGVMDLLNDNAIQIKV